MKNSGNLAGNLAQQLAAGQIPAIRFRIRDLQQVGRDSPATVLAKTARNVMPGWTFRRGIKRFGTNMLRLPNRFMLEHTAPCKSC